MVALNFPMVSQRTTVTGDGKPSENAQQDCVAASIDAVCRYLLNDPENSVFNPDHFKDEAYGEAYTGGTSADHYVAFCQSLGIHLYAIDAPFHTNILATARGLLAQGHPVIFTETDPYVDTNLPQYKGWTHVCVWYADDGEGLTAMDPWVARPIYKSDSGWSDVIAVPQFWTAERIEDMIQSLSIDMPDVAKLFRQLDENHWQSIATGRILQFGLLADYRTNGQNSLVYLGDVISPELVQHNGDVVQFYQHGARLWQKATGKVLPFDVFSRAGQDILRKLLAVPAPAPEVPQEHAALLQIKEIVSKLS